MVMMMKHVESHVSARYRHENNCISLAFGSILLAYMICMPFLYISILRYGLPLICYLKKILFVNQFSADLWHCLVIVKIAK